MDFYAVLDQVVDLLRSRGRVSYRALKREFDLDDEDVEETVEEIFDQLFGGQDPFSAPAPRRRQLVGDRVERPRRRHLRRRRPVRRSRASRRRERSGGAPNGVRRPRKAERGRRSSGNGHCGPGWGNAGKAGRAGPGRAGGKRLDETPIMVGLNELVVGYMRKGLLK